MRVDRDRLGDSRAAEAARRRVVLRLVERDLLLLEERPVEEDVGVEDPSTQWRDSGAAP